MNRAASNPDWSFCRSSRAKTLCLLVAAFTTACGGGGNGGSSSSNPPPTSNITVSVSPVSVTVAPSGSVQFTATVTGTTNTTVMWTATGSDGSTANVGLISASGVYTAPGTPPSPSIVNIKATSVVDATKSGIATANILVHHINQDAQQPPIKLGTSGGNATDSRTTTDPATGKRETFCCSGTLGSLVSRGGEFYILSNNHVLDKSDQGAVGDPISQPGLADAHCGQDASIVVANMTQAVPLNSKTVDAAIAKIIPNQVDTTGAILDLGGPGQPLPPSSQIATPTARQQVAKSGDATGVTCSSITSIDTPVTVHYRTQCEGGDDFSVTFPNQIVIAGSNFSNSGDSGSLVVTSDTAQPVGLLYAGSPDTTVAHPIADVLAALKDPNSSEIPKIVGAGNHPVPCTAAPQSEGVPESEQTTVALSREQLQRVATAIQTHRGELLRDSAVFDLRAGRSDDNPDNPALLILVTNPPETRLPVEVDGIRTKVVETRQLAIANTNGLRALSQEEIERAKAVKDRHSEAMMKNPVILGVGVGASLDSAGESALVVYVEKGKEANVPVAIDGVRTRIFITEPFRAYNWGKRTRNSCSKR